MRPAVAVIQARMGSSRLPGKAILPIGGIPMVILAALRVRPACEVRIATTASDIDSVIVEYAQRFDIPVVQGAESDALYRFVQATKDLEDDTPVIRLTADNVFPDATFIQLVLDQYKQCEYPTYCAPSNTPYGLIAEVFPCGMLREAHKMVCSPYEREHVTPWLKTHYGRFFTVPNIPQEWHDLRCTVDTVEDYNQIRKVFELHGGDPVQALWYDLCEILSRNQTARIPRVSFNVINDEPHSELVLGTAQLGMPYGRTGNKQLLSEKDAMQILSNAVKHGITHVDTARVYGQSEYRIGKFLASGFQGNLMVMTKLDPLESLQKESLTVESLCQLVDNSILRSCRELRTYQLDVVLLHRARHLWDYGGMVWKRLCELKREGMVKRLGVSVQDVDEIVRALEEPEVSYLQVPFNVLDRRWLAAEVQEKLNQRKDVVVHARSVLLQGILATPDPKLWPRISGVDPKMILNKLAELTQELQRHSVLDLLLTYVRSQRWIDSIVLGVETTRQLAEAVKVMQSSKMTTEEIAVVQRALPLVPEELVDPRRWNRV